VELILFALPVLLLFLMFNSQRKRQRAAEQLQASLQPGQQVVTTSGMFAHVVRLEDAAAVLEIAPGVHVRWDRRAIGSVVSDGAPGGALEAAGTTSADVTVEPPTAGSTGPTGGPAVPPPGQPGAPARPADEN
jgi:preprotein translocase subunit YajC